MNVALSPILTETFAMHPPEKFGGESAHVLYLNMSGNKDNAFADDGWCKIKCTMNRHDDRVKSNSFITTIRVIKFNCHSAFLYCYLMNYIYIYIYIYIYYVICDCFLPDWKEKLIIV